MTSAPTLIDALPVAGLGFWPTPLHRLDRLSAEFGTEIWIKRDDVQGVALAGNKLRKFDVVLGRALAAGADTLVTTGAIQSNSARTGAAAAAAVGMRCVLVLSGEAPATPTGNLVLDHIVGADVRFAGSASWAELNATVDAVVADLARRGRRAVAAPVGCSSPLGTLGFARAFLELDAQCQAVGLTPSAVVHTSTSGGTHAGLLVGRAAAGRDVRVIGIDAGDLYSDRTGALATLAEAAAAEVGMALTVDPASIELVTSQLGAGYGQPTAAAAAAIGRLARTEAIVTDPVYSGKGLAGLFELIETGAVTGPVVFWHTGGYHAVFDPRHGEPLLDALGADNGP
ncbi:MAG: pyridoxal-phosphate dependent enzyme [Actinomycetota bacterium]